MKGNPMALRKWTAAEMKKVNLIMCAIVGSVAIAFFLFKLYFFAMFTAFFAGAFFQEAFNRWIEEKYGDSTTPAKKQ